MIIYKINFDKNRRIYCLVKKEKVFIKYIKNFKKLATSSKSKSNSKFI